MAHRETRVPTRGGILTILAAQCTLMIALGLILWDWSGRPLRRFVSFAPAELAQGIGLGLALIAFAFALWRLFPRAGEKLIRMQAQSYRFLGPNLGWPAIVFIALCAGAGEEALFRGGLQTLLGDHIGVPAAIALASLVFALVHLGKPAVTGLIFAVGCLFGAVYAATESLLTVMIGHALYDIWALRYLQREMLRLDLFAENEFAEEKEGDPMLAKAAPDG